MSDALVLTNVTKRFGDFTAVDRFSLHVPRGEVLGFLGPNGAGKTTTIRMIMGITMPDSGSLELLGAKDPMKMKDRVGYLPEERGLYRKMTVEATLKYFGQLKGLSGHTLRQRIDEGLERMGLGDWKKKKVETLSKGMSQKIQFLATIMHKPELVILDEPFSGLDPINRDLLEKLITELRQSGVTIIFSTHQMETAEDLCDRIVLINRGRVLVEGTLDAVKGQYPSRTVVLEGAGDFHSTARWEGVAAAQATYGAARLELLENVDPQAILARAVGAFRLTRFEVLRPNLQEIFVKLVGADALDDESDDDRGPTNGRAAALENAHA